MVIISTEWSNDVSPALKLLTKKKNHDPLPTGIKVTNYPSHAPDRHSLEEPTLCYSVTGSLFQVRALFPLIERGCISTGSTFAFCHLLAAVLHMRLVAEDAASSAEGAARCCLENV